VVNLGVSKTTLFETQKLIMTDEERVMLDNVLDGLDRLFDTESDAIDLYALIFATSKAVSKTEHFAILSNAAQDLEKIVRAGMNADDERFEALRVTDDLRHYLAEILDYVNLKLNH
jgi:hypothetical protein